MLKKIAASLIVLSTLYFILFRYPHYQFQTISSYKDIEIESIECPGTLVLFDIDDTLISSNVKFSLPSRLYMFLLNPQILYDAHWVDFSSRLWQQACFKLIDPCVVELINMLKADGCMVLGLTSMESGAYGVISSMPEWRYQTLAQFGIEFTQKFGDHTFKSLPAYRDNYPVLYKGILCANQQSKGKVLEAFLKQLELQPKQVISFDDNPVALRSIQEACEGLRIPITCYQYNRLNIRGG